MDRYTDLDAVLDRVWTRMESAAADPGHPFRTLTFGTVQGATPTLRTVVLRDAQRDGRRLAFHTDRRSQKVADVRSHERIAWHGWDAEAREQVRLRGRGFVHVDDAVTEEMWADQEPRSLAVYPKSAAPGASIDAPRDALADSVQERPISRDDVAEGKRHFAVIRTIIDEVDWLHLHPEGHYRAQFRFERNQQAFAGTWVVP
jgi:hypothetical protein